MKPRLVPTRVICYVSHSLSRRNDRLVERRTSSALLSHSWLLGFAEIEASPLVVCSVWSGKRSSLSRRPIRAMGSSASSQSSDNFQEARAENDHSELSDDDWKKRLTKEQYYITRQKGTERAFTGEYWNTKTPGTYHCICCDSPLFESTTKFDSGTGWPSFYESVGNNVKTKLDMSIIFMPRQESLCSTCGAHLGHIFDDGPPPTGKRYCINSASLKLKS